MTVGPATPEERLDGVSTATAGLVSLVIPVYRNEASIPGLLLALNDLAKLVQVPLEVVLVVDGSPDQSWSLLKQTLPEQPFRTKLCLHSRNFGAFAAVRTGLRAASGDCIAVMAADLQEPVSLIADFFAALATGEVDIAVGRREGRADPFMTRAFSSLFWWAYRRLVIPEIPEGGVDVFACTRSCRDELLRLEETNSSLVGLIFWVGFRRKEFSYRRAARLYGTSAWSFGRRVRYLLDSVYSFSDLPIRILKWSGMLTLSAALLFGSVVVYSRLSEKIEVPGYAATVLTIVFFGGLNSLGLGVLGEYVWRTFENTKRRPLSILMNMQSFEGRK